MLVSSSGLQGFLLQEKNFVALKKLLTKLQLNYWLHIFISYCYSSSCYLSFAKLTQSVNLVVLLRNKLYFPLVMMLFVDLKESYVFGNIFRILLLLVGPCWLSVLYIQCGF